MACLKVQVTLSEWFQGGLSMILRARVTIEEHFLERSRWSLSTRAQWDIKSQRISFASARPARPCATRSMRSVTASPSSSRTSMALRQLSSASWSFPPWIEGQ